MITLKTLHGIHKGIGMKFPLLAVWISPQLDTPAHLQEFIEMVIIFSGSGFHELEGNSTMVKPGDIFVVPYRSRHGYHHCTPDFALMNLIYSPSLLSLPQLDVSLLPGYQYLFHQPELGNQHYPLMHLNEENFTLIRQIAWRMHEETEERKPGYQFILQGLFMGVLGILSRLYSQECKSGESHYQNLEKVIACLNRNFKKEIGISSLCSMAGMAKATLMRNFQKITGTTPHQYQLQLRLADAALLLRDPKKSLTDIASECGFHDANYFSRRFKKHFGVTPGQFRQQGIEK